MKNKLLTYLLLCLVLVIWGMIIYRFISSDKPADKGHTINNLSTNTFKKPKNYKLLLNYQEAFLNTVYKSKNVNYKKKSIKKTENILPLTIKYTGLIRNKKNYLNTIVLLQIDNVETYLKINQVIMGYKLIKFDNSKVLFSKDGRKFEILKSHE